MDVDEVELRVLGCLIEKQRTTPDQYPLSLNALRLACNQTTNRDPVVDYDEQAIRDALTRMSNRGWTRLASGPGSRAVKFRHLLDEALTVSPSELAVLAVLMLRGEQTPGELKQRTERLYPFSTLDDVEATLDRLIERELVARRSVSCGENLRPCRWTWSPSHSRKAANSPRSTFSSMSSMSSVARSQIWTDITVPSRYVEK